MFTKMQSIFSQGKLIGAYHTFSFSLEIGAKRKEKSASFLTKLLSLNKNEKLKICLTLPQYSSAS